MSEQKTSETTAVKKSKCVIDIVMFVLFCVSLLPYLILPYFSIEGTGFLWSDKDYGFDAWLFSFIVLCIHTPIFPFTIIYQIVFVASRYAKLSQLLKQSTKILIIVTLVITLVPPTIVEISQYIKAKEVYNKNEAAIEEYLIDEFGKENFNNMRIILPDDADSTTYKVVSPLLKQRFTVTIDDDGISNNFDTLFIKQHDLTTKLTEKLTDECNIPNDISISIRNINITNYSDIKNIDKILDSCKYRLDYVTFNCTEYNKENVVEQIKDFFDIYGEKLSLNKDNDTNWPNFLVRLNGEKYAHIHMLISESQNAVRITFRGYDNGLGYTVETEDVYITFD